jgi:hypothetical protein
MRTALRWSRTWVLGLALAACSSSIHCTLIGCGGVVDFHLSSAARAGLQARSGRLLTACVGGDCRQARAPTWLRPWRSDQGLTFDPRHGVRFAVPQQQSTQRPMLVSLMICDPSGHTLLAFTDQHPNLQPDQPNGHGAGQPVGEASSASGEHRRRSSSADLTESH